MPHIDASSLRRRYLLALALVPLAGCGTAATECLSVDDTADPTCPSEAEAGDLLLGAKCGYTVNAVTGPGSIEMVAQPWDTGDAIPQCCFPTLETEDTMPSCVVGRPFLEEGVIRTAPATARPGWARGRRPEVRALTPAERTILARAWTEDALIEHASVAAFARTTLELLAVGAPADLLAAVQAAAADEVRHARLSFALAERYGAAPVSPGRFELGASVSIETDLARLAASTFREGCVGETVVSLLSARAAADATDPAAKALLTLVAQDEARHAELAWRTLSWLLQEGGAAALAAVEAEVEHLLLAGVRLTQITTGADDGVLAAHGRIRPAAAMLARDQAVAEVILPCVRALLGHLAALAA
ncbi:MAG: ferritin-like domain-containing protein [Myxococcales bacterium]|nr:ferritin-like domain-containing protein [Myxococcales bacterium]